MKMTLNEEFKQLLTNSNLNIEVGPNYQHFSHYQDSNETESTFNEEVELVLRYLEFENRVQYLSLALLAPWAGQYWEPQKNNEDFSLEKSSSKRLSFEGLLKGLNYVVLQESDFQPSAKQNLQLCISRNFLQRRRNCIPRVQGNDLD